jgi:HK97 family phage major capsid protein
MNKKDRAYCEERIKFLAGRHQRGTLTMAERRESVDLEEKLAADDARVNAYQETGGYGHTMTRTAEDRAFSDYLRTGRAGPELRAAGEAVGSQGGFLVPEGFWNSLRVALKQYGGMSQDMAQVITDDGRLMPFPTNNPISVLASYASENTQVSDTNYTFGEGQLYAWTLVSGAVRASLQLSQDSATNLDAFVATRIGEQIGRKMAAEVVTGGGPSAKAATGIVPALTSFGTVSGASGGVLNLGTATAVKQFSQAASTELITNTLAPQTAFAMIAAVDPAYWYVDGGCAFYMNATQALGMRQVSDANGRPLLNLDDGLSDDYIGTIGGFPVKVVQEIGNLTASTVSGPVFGNMQHAMALRLVRGGGSGILTLRERWADFLQIGWIGWQRWDAQPMDLRAACVVKAAAT